MASMEKEFFWGCELSKDKKQYSWDSEEEELSKADIEQKLVLSQACLGAKAKPNERNVVEVTTTDSSNNSVTHTILSLQSGRIDQCRLSLGFPSSVDFKLVEGSGPLHLTGSVYQELYVGEDDEEDSDEDEEPPNFVELEKVTSKKRPLASETPKGPPKKLARVEHEEEEEEEDKDESDDEDESSEETEKMELDTKEKHKKPDTTKAPSSKTEGKDAKVKKAKEESDDEEESNDDEDEDDDDEDEEEDEDESGEDESDEDDDDDDDDDDESDEEDEIADSLTAKKKGGKTEQKKPITNGVTKPGKKPTEEKEKPNKTPGKQPSTPKTGGKKEDAKKAATKSPEPLSIEQIKEKLKKATSLPKKVDKFKNYMKSTFKMTDEAAVTKLWDWLKDNK